MSHQVTAVFLCDCYPQYQHQSRCTICHCGHLELPVLCRPVGQHSLFLFPLALLLGTWGFLLSLNHDLFACQLSSCGRVLTRGPSFECSLFHSSPSLVISWGLEVEGCLVYSPLTTSCQETEWVYSKPRNPHRVCCWCTLALDHVMTCGLTSTACGLLVVWLAANAVPSKPPTHDHSAGDSGSNELQHAALSGMVYA